MLETYGLEVVDPLELHLDLECDTSWCKKYQGRTGGKIENAYRS
jgi:hypothetical protein